MALLAIAGCAVPQRTAPPPGPIVAATYPHVIGPYVTQSAIVRVDGFRGPEFHETWYTYTAMLVEGSAAFTDSGALEVTEGTVYVSVRRESRRVPIAKAIAPTSWASAVPGEGESESPWAADPDRLLAIEMSPRPGGAGSSTSTPMALWWYPIVVSDPTQQGTVGTNIVVQQSVDGNGRAHSRVFLRPPLQHLFRDRAQMWISSNDPLPIGSGTKKDYEVGWVLGTDVVAHSTETSDGVVTTVQPIDAATQTWLETIDADAARLGVKR